MRYLAMDSNCDDTRACAELRARLLHLGAPVGQLDLLIGGQALARDRTLVTRNTREFQRMSGLRLADREIG